MNVNNNVNSNNNNLNGINTNVNSQNNNNANANNNAANIILVMPGKKKRRSATRCKIENCFLLLFAPFFAPSLNTKTTLTKQHIISGEAKEFSWSEPQGLLSKESNMSCRGAPRCTM